MTDNDIELSEIHEVEVDDSKLTCREKNILKGKHFDRFDAKKVYAFKYKIMPNTHYLEELLLPRYSSLHRYIVSPILYSIINGAYGLSVSMYNRVSKVSTVSTYLRQGMCISIPYYLCNEIVTGILIRAYGREQYFVSHVSSYFLCMLSYIAFTTSRRGFSQSISRIISMNSRLININITSMYLEMMFIYQRDVLLDRHANMRPSFHRGETHS